MSGQSGGPIMIERDGSYFIVGVHIGGHRVSKKNIANCLNK
jgi:V8-like Glu-specific endopeptidase